MKCCSRRFFSINSKTASASFLGRFLSCVNAVSVGIQIRFVQTLSDIRVIAGGQTAKNVDVAIGADPIAQLGDLENDFSRFVVLAFFGEFVREEEKFADDRCFGEVRIAADLGVITMTGCCEKLLETSAPKNVVSFKRGDVCFEFGSGFGETEAGADHQLDSILDRKSV